MDKYNRNHKYPCPKCGSLSHKATCQKSFREGREPSLFDWVITVYCDWCGAFIKNCLPLDAEDSGYDHDRGLPDKTSSDDGGFNDRYPFLQRDDIWGIRSGQNSPGNDDRTEDHSAG